MLTRQGNMAQQPFARQGADLSATTAWRGDGTFETGDELGRETCGGREASEEEVGQVGVGVPQTRSSRQRTVEASDTGRTASVRPHVNFLVEHDS